MAEIICPLCGKPNPPERDVCQYCEAPLKTSGFIASPEDEDVFNQIPTPTSGAGTPSDQAAPPASTSSLEQAIPDWLKQTEASFLGEAETEASEQATDKLSKEIDELINLTSTSSEGEKPALDDEWLASLLSEAGVGELAEISPPSEPQVRLPGGEAGELEQMGAEPGEQIGSPGEPEKPDWLTNLEASSTIKLEGGIQPSEAGLAGEKETGLEPTEPKAPEQPEVPEWVGKTNFGETPPGPLETEAPLEPAEIPAWLEALRPSEKKATPTGPVEDISAADIVTAGPLVGLRGVISPHPSAIQARKPPTYSIKLRVTDEQRARLEMMEQLLADEQKPKPMPSKPVITYRHIFRLVVAALLILPILWMIIFRSEKAPIPQPGDVPGVVDFAHQVQNLPTGAPVLLAFDYEPGFSGELNVGLSTLLTQLFNKNAYLTLVTTTPSGPALAESLMRNASSGGNAASAKYANYTDLGFIPGGTMGLFALAASPSSTLPYSIDGYNVWSVAPLNTISSVADFYAVILITHDPDTARAWIEQVGPQLKTRDKPLLVVTSKQAEPLIRPYYQATPAQVQGIVAGLEGGLAYARLSGAQLQSGVWDALSVAVTISVLVIIVGSVISVAFKSLSVKRKKED